MASFSRKSGIVGALIIAAVLIGGAFILSSNPSTFFHAQVADAESTQQLLQDYSQKDSDHDGLPDWEEALYGTDPYNAHSFSPTLTDGQAVAEGLIKPKFTTTAAESSTTDAAEQVPGIAAAPGSMTDQFAQNLFGQFISQSGGKDPSTSDIDSFAQQAMQQEVQNHTHTDSYTLSDVKTSGTGSDAMLAYEDSADGVLSSQNVSASEDELTYFSDDEEKNDPDALSKVAAIGNAYTAMAVGLIAIPSPVEAQYAHLEIANAMANLGEDITDMSMANTDPLRAYLGLQQYEVDTPALTAAYADMYVVFAKDGITDSYTTSQSNFYRSSLLAASVEVLSNASTTSP
jgi:hypothetical protein